MHWRTDEVCGANGCTAALVALLHTMPPRRAATSQSSHPVVAFDPAKETLVLDCKGLSMLPFNESSHVKSFRALALPKGKFVHVPKMAGRYFVLGSYRAHTVLQLVHFRADVNRDPELLINFVDQADSNGNAMVQTVQLPVEVRSGVFQKNTVTSTADDVIGFQQLDTTKTPWSTSLAPFLKQNDQYRSLKIENGHDMLGYIGKQLGSRIDGLLKRSELSIVAEYEAAKVQDELLAGEEQEAAKVQLKALVEGLKKLPPESYDATLSNRITTVQLLDAPGHEEQTLPDWLTSPLRGQLNTGTAKAVPTFMTSPIRKSKRLMAQDEEEQGLVGDDDDSLQNGDDDEDDDDDDSDSELSDDDEESDDGAVVASKRARIAPERLIPGSASTAAAKGGKGGKISCGKGKAKAAAPRKPAKEKKDKSCPPGVDPEAPFGRKKNGKPYARACGAYKRNLVKAVTKTASDSVDRAAADAITKLTEANEKLNEELKTALKDLAELKGAGDAKEQIAKLQGQVDKADAAHSAYIAGLTKGMELATGRAAAITPASAAQAGPSNS